MSMTEAEALKGRIENSKEKGAPLFLIKCDVCGFVDTSMCEGGSSFDFCDAPNSEADEWVTVTEDGIDYHFQANHRTDDNYQVKELTGMYPSLVEYQYITRG
jgi:hypothetical protein